MKKIILALIGLAFALPYGIGHADPDAGVGIRRIVITKHRPAFGGASFGSAGPYEVMVGTAYGELDPKAPMNAGIVNLPYAPVNDKGHVEYSMDITILKPVDINKGNGRLIYDVLNRGHEKALSDLNLSKFSSIGPEEVTDPATGYIMKRGYAVAWSGWEAEQSAETARPGLQKAKFPIAMRDGKPMVGMSHEELTSFPAGPSFKKELTYPAANLDTSAATLIVREHQQDAPKTLSPSDWSYIDAKHVRINTVPGFGTEAIYELFYQATDPVVEGMAFASMRDFVLFLRYAEKDSTGQPNPIHPATPFKAVLGVGISESGRFLRDMVYQDFNVDDSGHVVFDGILSAVTGSRKTNVNTEFSQPGRFSRQHEDHLFPGDQFPFTYATTTDPISGKTDGIQVKCTKSKSCPKIFHIDTNTDVWQGRASLVVTDPAGKPVAIPENVRVYIPTGIPHESDAGNPANGTPEGLGICKYRKSPLQYRYYVRALFADLDSWVTDGVAPPPSQYPNLKNHTLIPVAEEAKYWPSIPGYPYTPVINKLRLTDYSKVPPAVSGPEYPVLIARTNTDGNPIGGIEPPEVAVPLGTYSGQNIRGEGYGEGDLCGLNGSYMPFALTKKERLASGDSRLSIEERYASQEDFAAKRKQAADRLVEQRLLLPEDAAKITAETLPKATVAEAISK
ncbi:MAG: alpha/beta hydrolase domain-containing protein [Candidatus Acidiferrales bacterium]|jgi:hypothetical protein